MKLAGFLSIVSILSLFSLSVHASPQDRADGLKHKLAAYQGRPIHKISIVRKNVFDDEMLSNPPFYFRWANSLHIVTRENVVRREILFDIGDTLDIQRVFETERNLRAGGFIGEIDIVATPDSNNGIELTIMTTDLWTTKAEAYLDVAGGNYTTGLSVTEGNILGYGKYMQAVAQVGNDQDGFAAYYIDNRLFGSRFAFSYSYSDFTYSKGFTISLARPQYSLTVPYGLRAGFSNLHAWPRLFYEGQEIFRFHQDRKTFAVEGIFTRGHNRRLNFYSGYTADKFDYSVDDPLHPLNSIIPDDEVLSYPTIGAGVSTIKYDVDRFLDASGTPEDLALGASLKFTFGRSDKPFGADYIGNYYSAAARFLVHPLSRLYLAANDKVMWWYADHRAERINHRTELALYYKPAPMHTLVARGLTDFGWRQKATYQQVLGGGNGLRGYSYFEFSGDKLALGNIEYRFYTPVTILTVRLGAAAFFDFGNVWWRNEPVDVGELKTSAGAGLRFGLTKSSTSRVISLDFARALSQDDFFIGFGTSLGFSLSAFGINE
jgi:hypothetical protein